MKIQTAFAGTILAATLFLLSSCKCGFFYKCDDDPQPTTLYPEALGHWQCIRKTGGFGGADSNMINEGVFLTLRDDGSYIRERQTKRNAGRYMVTLEGGHYKIEWDDYPFSQFAEVNLDTLRLADDASDAWDYIYIRR